MVSLVNVVPELAGENCSSGGYKFETGIDFNKNNKLDSDEVQSVDYVCNGNDGQNALVDVKLESAGENCQYSGVKIVSGIDSNNNGVLDEIEIENTEYVCNGNSEYIYYLPAEGLTAYYPFNGNANDVSGNRFNCVNYGESRYPTAVINEGRHFVVDLDNHEYLEIPNMINNDEYTISFWVKFADSSVHNTLLAFGTANDWVRSDLWIYTSTSRLAIIQDEQDIRTANYGHIGHYPKSDKFLSSEVLKSDRFYFVSVVYSDRELKLYLDGNLYNVYEDVNPIPISQAKGYVGIIPHQNQLRYQLDGVLDELSIYDRALSEEEILLLYGN